MAIRPTEEIAIVNSCQEETQRDSHLGGGRRETAAAWAYFVLSPGIRREKQIMGFPFESLSLTRFSGLYGIGPSHAVWYVIL